MVYNLFYLRKVYINNQISENISGNDYVKKQKTKLQRKKNKKQKTKLKKYKRFIQKKCVLKK